MWSSQEFRIWESFRMNRSHRRQGNAYFTLMISKPSDPIHQEISLVAVCAAAIASLAFVISSTLLLSPFEPSASCLTLVNHLS